VTAQGHTWNVAAQTGPDQGADSVTVGSGLVRSRTRGREAEASPAREPGSGVGRGIRGLQRRYRKANRVPVDPGPAMVTDGFDELGDDDDDSQGP
jgi:hypothetical protein